MRQLQIHPDDNVVVNVGGEYNGHKTAIRDVKARREYHKIWISHRPRDMRYKKKESTYIRTTSRPT